MEKIVAKPTKANQEEVTEIQSEVIETTDQKPKYDKDELLVIFDEILFSGEYREDVSIKGKLNVTFKTRSAKDTSDIARELDSMKFNMMSSMLQYKALLSLCYSIVMYGGRDLSSMNVEQRQQFIEKLPTVMVAALSDALVRFDLKTEAALGEMDSF